MKTKKEISPKYNILTTILWYPNLLKEHYNNSKHWTMITYWNLLHNKKVVNKQKQDLIRSILKIKYGSK